MQMSRKTGFIVILITLLLAGVMTYFPGCEQSQQSGTPQSVATNTKTEASKTSEVKVDLELDKLPANASVSMTSNYYFVFDGSGSMLDDNKIIEAKKACTIFINSLPENINVGLIVFDNNRRADHDFNEVIPLSPINKQKLLDAIKAIDPNSGTPLGEAIVFAVNRLKEQRKLQMGYGEFRLIVITDGQANGKVEIKDAGLLAMQKAVPIYTLGFKMDSDHELYKWSLWHATANTQEELVKGLQETVSESDVFEPTEFQVDSEPVSGQ
jgi:Ca-activated chloride channel homolog